MKDEEIIEALKNMDKKTYIQLDDVSRMEIADKRDKYIEIVKEIKTYLKINIDMFTRNDDYVTSTIYKTILKRVEEMEKENDNKIS